MDKSYTVERLTLPDGLVLTLPQCTVYIHMYVVEEGVQGVTK